MKSRNFVRVTRSSGIDIPSLPMSSTSIPELPSQPSFLRRHGCLVFLLTIVALFVIAVMVGYHMLVSTAMPYRFIASMIQKANPNVHIEGITGDLKTGVGVSSITWGVMPRREAVARSICTRACRP